jgi:hypothetical protein
MWALLLVATLNGIANDTKVAIRRMAALNLSKGITFAPQNHKQVDRTGASAGGGAAAGILPASVVKRQAGFENLAGADAFVTDLSADPGEQPGALRIAAVVYVKAALPDLRPVITQYSLIPWLIELGWPDPHFAVIDHQLHADLDALVANISGMAFKESRDLSLAHGAERTPQDGPVCLRDQSAAEVEVSGAC